MAFDEGLAERLRTALEGVAHVTEQRMFGGLAFLVAGKMCVGILKDALLVRVGREKYDQALAQPDARPMIFTSRPMKGFVSVDPEGFEADEQLEWWVAEGVACAHAAAKAKPKRPRASPAKRPRR